MVLSIMAKLIACIIVKTANTWGIDRLFLQQDKVMRIKDNFCWILFTDEEVAKFLPLELSSNK